MCEQLCISQLYIDRNNGSNHEKADRCIRTIATALSDNEFGECAEFETCTLRAGDTKFDFGQFVDLIKYAALSVFGEISAFFQLHCPAPHIVACSNLAWKESLRFEKVSFSDKAIEFEVKTELTQIMCAFNRICPNAASCCTEWWRIFELTLLSQNSSKRAINCSISQTSTCRLLE